MGAAVVLGQLASSSAFAGVDSAAHMAEEVCCFLYIILRTITHDSEGQRRLTHGSSYDDAYYDPQWRAGSCGDDYCLLYHRGH
jgi:hypothetical protein